MFDDWIAGLGFSADGGVLAVSCAEGAVHVLVAADSNARPHRLGSHDFGATSLSWHRRNRIFATAGQDAHVNLWDADSGRCLRRFPAQAPWVERVAFSPVTDLLAAGAGRAVHVWRLDGELLYHHSEHGGTVNDLCWRQDGRHLAAAAYGGVTIHAPDASDRPRRLKWKGASLALAWSPDGRYIATGDQDATVHLWRVAKGTDAQMRGYPTKVRELAWDAQSRWLATGGGAGAVIWDCRGAGPEGRRPTVMEGHDARLSAVAFRPRGTVLASTDERGLLCLWTSPRNPVPLFRFGLNAAITALSWSADGSRIACGTASGQVVVFAVG